jgi:hypothetical protein
MFDQGQNVRLRSSIRYLQVANRVNGRAEDKMDRGVAILPTSARSTAPLDETRN